VSSREFQERLARRARRAGLTIRPELGAQLEIYYRLLSTWNKKINLTGLNLSEFGPEALDRLLIEPLVAASHVRPAVRSVLDIGSGGGSPALPLALALPDVTLLMVEAKTRKSVFLREALRALGLARGEVITSRFEELLAKPRLHEAHDLLTIRAVRVEATWRGDLSVSDNCRCFWPCCGDATARLESLLPPPRTSKHPGCVGQKTGWLSEQKRST
jgi:16S rRNA (guanine(527)-N(7))-methyltransferase RsmG